MLDTNADTNDDLSAEDEVESQSAINQRLRLVAGKPEITCTTPKQNPDSTDADGAGGKCAAPCTVR
jgi:hypothetical protein